MTFSRQICVPRPRTHGLLGLLRAAWIAPTTWLGHLVAWLAGCGPSEAIGGTAAHAWLYRLPPGRLRGLGAIAIGHAIIVEPSFLEGRTHWLLAHELSHARQHDWLGPAYLPIHALLQLFSALFFIVRPLAGFPPQHAYNPLERSLLCVPFDIFAAGELPSGPLARELLRAFGFEPDEPTTAHTPRTGPRKPSS